MAIDPARVVKPRPVPDDMVCIICTGVLQNPVEGPCEHLACRECLTTWLERPGDKNCPTCRQPLAEGAVKPAHRLLRNQLDDFELTCDNAPRGCPAIVNLGKLQSHLSSCGKAIEPCRNNGCTALVMREDMPNHLKACLHRTVSCAQCNASIKYQDEQNHLLYTCPGMGVTCQHNGGCGKSVQRKAMRAHIDTECSRAMMTCAVPGCQKQVARGDMKAHLQDSMAEHVASLSIALQQANAKIAEQGAELAKLKKSVPINAFQCVATLHGHEECPCIDTKSVNFLVAGNGVLYSMDAHQRIQAWDLQDHTKKKVRQWKASNLLNLLAVDEGVLCGLSEIYEHAVLGLSVLDSSCKELSTREVSLREVYSWGKRECFDISDPVVSKGRAFAIRREDGRVVQLQGEDGPLASLEGQQPSLTSIDYEERVDCLALDGTVLYGALYGKVKVWDTTTGKLTRTLKGEAEHGPKKLALSDGMIYLLCRNDTVQVWSTISGALLAVTRATGNLFAAGGGHFFRCGAAGIIMAWSARDNYRWLVELCEHTTEVTALHVHEGMLYSGSQDGKIKIWRIPTYD
eukprot:jgi/Mesvir1/12302/Mv00504-RA.1